MDSVNFNRKNEIKKIFEKELALKPKELAWELQQSIFETHSTLESYGFLLRNFKNESGSAERDNDGMIAIGTQIEKIETRLYELWQLAEILGSKL